MPLYSMSASKLSFYSGVDDPLDKVLERATRWNAVLLLDDSDVFLEQRYFGDRERGCKSSYP